MYVTMGSKRWYVPLQQADSGASGGSSDAGSGDPQGQPGQGTEPSAQGGSGSAGTGGNSGKGKVTFTPEQQQEVDRIVETRLGRLKDQYKDYEELKAKAAKLAEYERAQLSEQERLQADLEAAKAQAQAAQQELNALKLAMLKAEVLDEVGLPRTFASRLVGEDRDALLADAKQLKEAIGTPSQGASVGGQGSNPANGGSSTGGGKVYTRTMLSQMTPEQINADWDNIQRQLQQGLIK